MTLGLVARADLGSGLQSQTLNLCKMLRPDKVLIVDSTPFNGNKQHFELYDQFNTDKVWGFPQMDVYRQWLEGLTHVLTAESFYNENVVNFCMRNNIKTYRQVNPEFYSHNLTAPDKFLMPSHWHLEDYQERYPDRVEYLPPPLYPNDFKQAREVNFKRSGRRKFLLPVGKPASKDRAGYMAVMDALPYTKSDFEIIVRSQFELEYQTEDQRVSYDIRNLENQQDIYKGFDAVLHLRRYAGLSLVCNEALMSGLPVIMPRCSPNDKLLPDKWLVDADITDKLLTRMVLDVYTARPEGIAQKIDWLCDTSHNELQNEKVEAFDIAMREFSADVLKGKYKEVLK